MNSPCINSHIFELQMHRAAFRCSGVWGEGMDEPFFLIMIRRYERKDTE
jgi:hypothetical protein